MKFNRLKILLFIVILALYTIYQINNVIQINLLLKENRELEQKLEKLKSEKAVLLLKIAELQSAERIIKYAEKEFGMVLPDKAPIVIKKIDENEK